jgi:plasmid segregation protein ParM
MYVLAVDIGYSNLKIVRGFVDRPDLDIQVMPVGAAPIENMCTDAHGNINEGVEVLVDGQHYIAGVEPHSLSGWERALHEDYTKSPEYKALFFAALKTSGMERISKVVTGLPVSHYREEGRADELKKRLAGVHEVAPGHTVEVMEVEVVPQPIGSFLNVLDGMPAEEELFASETLVIDPGFFSVDWVYLSEFKVRHEWSGSSTLATSSVIEEAVSLIKAEYDYRTNLNKIELAIRDGRRFILAGGAKVELEEILKRAAVSIKPALSNHLKSSMRGKTDDLDCVILTGGGAKYYGEAVKEMFPRAATSIQLPLH